MKDQFGTLPVSFEYGKTVGWQFVGGRDFSRDLKTDSMGMVINESAAKYMGLKNPVGESVSWKFQEEAPKHYIILGVVKDMLMESPYQPIYPTVFMIKGHVSPNWINIKINPIVSASQALPKIESVFKKVIPLAPFEPVFADEEFAKKFAAEIRIGKLATFFAILAILISCLGLFGLASYMAEQRTKEIGVRKVLGAGLQSILWLFGKEFVRLLIIAFLIAAPIAWWAMNKYLQEFKYRITIGPGIFALAIGSTLMVALLTVSYRSTMAAVANPVKSLHSE